MLHFIINRIQAYFALRSRVSEARALFRKDGKRRFVIPFNNGTMEVLTREQAMALKKEGHLASDLTPKLMYNACFFFTDTKELHNHVKCEMPQREFKRRRKSYYKWFDRHHTNCI